MNRENDGAVFRLTIARERVGFSLFRADNDQPSIFSVFPRLLLIGHQPKAEAMVFMPSATSASIFPVKAFQSAPKR